METEFETHVPSGVAADTRGKHRILAELKRLEQETRSLEEELEELEKTDKVSVACKELLLHIEARPDPLLPVTNGPTNPFWDRWFEGPQDSQGCRCWVLDPQPKNIYSSFPHCGRLEQAEIIEGVDDKMRWNPDSQKDFTVATAYQAAKEDDVQPFPHKLMLDVQCSLGNSQPSPYALPI